MRDFTSPPLSVIANFPPANHVNPERSGRYLTPVTCTITGLSIIVISARFWARGVVTRRIGVDDWSMLAALVFAIGMGILIIYEDISLDIGLHIWDYPMEKASLTRETLWIAEWFYAISAFFARFSVLIFYRRLQSGTYTSTFLWATWIGIAYNVLFSLHIPFFLMLIYRPFQAYWLSSDLQWVATHEYWHGREDIGLILNGALSTVGDIYTAIIPFLLVRSLNISKQDKKKLYILFSTGFIVVAVGCVRIMGMIDLVSTYDTTYRLPITWVWTMLELNVTIIAGSIPALKPLTKVFSIFLKSKGSSTTKVSGVTPNTYIMGRSAQTTAKHSRSRTAEKDIEMAPMPTDLKIPARAAASEIQERRPSFIPFHMARKSQTESELGSARRASQQKLPESISKEHLVQPDELEYQDP